MNKKIAIIRIRGTIGVNGNISKTLDILRLYRKNYCVVVDSTPNMLGMIKKIKDYVTFGKIDEETYNLLIEKKGEEYKSRETDSKEKIQYKRYIVVENKKYKSFFRLNPPKGGFERKGIKVNYHIGGVLGDRKDKMVDLIKRMV